MKKGQRNAVEAYKILQYAPVKQMSDDNQRKYSELVTIVLHSRGLYEGGVKSYTVIARPPLKINSGRM
jgi:hypothetical protein